MSASKQITDFSKNLFKTPPPSYNTSSFRAPFTIPTGYSSVRMPQTLIPPVTTSSSLPVVNEPVTAYSSADDNMETGTTSSVHTATSSISTTTSSTSTTAAGGDSGRVASTASSAGSQNLGKKFHSIIRLDPFSGNIDTSFIYWLNKYEKFCDLNNITEADRLNVMPFYLTSSALIYYNELPQHIKSNYTALKDALKERFESDSRYIDFSIPSAKQESLESVESYLNRICKLASDKNIPERLLKWFKTLTS